MVPATCDGEVLPVGVGSETDAPAAFDRLAGVYDESRGELDEQTVEGLSAALRSARVRSLLEIGVGTGRIAAPLVEKGFSVTGLDASIGMLARARNKGLGRLVVGTAYRLPFRSKSFDSTLLAHVLHLLHRPERALTEAIRVSRSSARALVTLRIEPGETTGTLPTDDDVRRALHESLRRDGVELSPRVPPWQTERALIARYPPDEVVPVSDRTVREPAERQIRFLEQRAYRNLLDVPEAPLRRAVQRLRDEFGGTTTCTRRVVGLAVWSRPP